MSGGAPPAARRWAISFADLALLIACTLMLGWRSAGTETSATRNRVMLVAVPVATMFVEGEAMLHPDGLAALGPAQRVVDNGGQVHVAVGMTQAGSRRLDAWELAAARTAAVARDLGVDRVILDAPTNDGQVHVSLAR
jgi:hypothetical protein